MTNLGSQVDERVVEVAGIATELRARKSDPGDQRDELLLGAVVVSQPDLASMTRAKYRQTLTVLEDEFGDAPITGAAYRCRTRGETC